MIATERHGRVPGGTMISTPFTTRVPFMGRQEELAELTERLNAAAAGDGSIVLLAGEPGIGKTRLAEELAALAAAPPHRARPWWGHCHEDEGAPAFWPDRKSVV